MKENKFEMTEINNDAFAVTAANGAPTIRETTTDDTRVLFNATSGGSKPVKDIIGKPIDVVHIVVTSADVHEDREDDTSPLENRPVVHFFTTDGEHYSTLSNGVVRTTKNLLACGLIPTGENPIRIVFREQPTKRGTAHIFELV